MGGIRDERTDNASEPRRVVEVTRVVLRSDKRLASTNRKPNCD